jgi:hypothetical protein
MRVADSSVTASRTSRPRRVAVAAAPIERTRVAQIVQHVPGVDDADDRCRRCARDDVQVQHVHVDVRIDHEALDVVPIPLERHRDGIARRRTRIRILASSRDAEQSAPGGDGGPAA